MNIYTVVLNKIVSHDDDVCNYNKQLDKKKVSILRPTLVAILKTGYALMKG